MTAEVAGLIGIALASLLASAGYIFQVTVEHKKTIRRVLYFMLEIRFALLASMFDSQEAVAKYSNNFFERCKMSGIDTHGIVFPDAMNTMMVVLLERGVAAAKSDLEDRLLGQFEESLLQLASVRPVLAYRLLGRHRLEKVVGLTKTYSNEMAGLARADETLTQHSKELIGRMSTTLRRKAFDDMVKSIDDDILCLARACSYLEYRRCSKALENTSLRLDHDFFSEVNQAIDQFIKTMMESVS